MNAQYFTGISEIFGMKSNVRGFPFGANLGEDS